MKKHFYLGGFTLALLALAQPVTAGQEIIIDSADLERRASEILRAEPEADRVTVRAEVEPHQLQNKYTVRLEDFDTNQDGILTRDEVGEFLFKIFDRDGNHVIDNIEMRRPGIITMAPIEKRTIEIVDFGDRANGVRQTVTQQEFLDESMLARFDTDGQGLTPLEFLGQSFNRVDVNRDGVIDLYEWKRAYAERVRPLHMEPFNYND